MLIVQKFHSIHEIDAEFIASIELLLKEDVPSFRSLIKKHDEAPASDVFTYFLFFGPTQNTPIGFAQLTLRKIPSGDFLPWWRKLMFWKKDHLHWKEAIWKSIDGSAGFCVFDSRFARSGKEKVQELISEYEGRPEIRAHHVYTLKGLQEYRPKRPEELLLTTESYILEPMPKSSKTYQDYLIQLGADQEKEIKSHWKSLHKKGEISLGDYPTPGHLKKSLPISQDLIDLWSTWGAQILTFEHGSTILGCLLILTGRDGNIFFEPMPFEPHGEAMVEDDLYIQYALLKFFELPEGRRCHLLKHGEKISFDNKDDLRFFVDQGFQVKTVVQHFSSNLKGLEKPL